jgi:peptidoglycan/xylan/chitin deacetylase (PgdA/CDA1 family)
VTVSSANTCRGDGGETAAFPAFPERFPTAASAYVPWLSKAICTRRGALIILGTGLSSAYLADRFANGSRVPFLITADVHGRPNLYDELSRCLDNLATARLKITFFVTADPATKPDIAPVLRRMLLEGHQVACHGLLHDGDEDYITNALDVQLRNLTRAKQLIEDAIGKTITAFRAPAFRISKHTLNILESLGFTTDLSVCSQRLPWLSSQVDNYRWLVAPRAPYHPSKTNPYAKGDLKLLEIPTSAALLPLMSSLNGVSLTAAKLTTTLLKYEASVVNKPIVYQCHHEDFILSNQPKRRSHVTWRSLIPNSRNGIPIRWLFLETDGQVLFKNNQEFITFVTQTTPFRFLTVDGYVRGRSSSHHDQ